MIAALGLVAWLAGFVIVCGTGDRLDCSDVVLLGWRWRCLITRGVTLWFVAVVTLGFAVALWPVVVVVLRFARSAFAQLRRTIKGFQPALVFQLHVAADGF